MKVATTISDFNGYTNSWAEAVQQFEGTGFRYLDFNFHSGYYPGSSFLGPNWMEEVEKAARSAEIHALRFVQAHAPCYDPFSKNVDHEMGMLAVRRSIEACAYLGIPNIVVHPGCSEEYLYPDGNAACWQKNREYYEQLYPAMEKYNVNVLIENSGTANMGNKCCFLTGREMAEFLQMCNHPLLHACWDTGHANMDGRDQYQNICDLGDHLRAIHFNDNCGAADEHIAPFMGTMDLDAVVQGLLHIGFQGYLTFEGKLLLRGNGWPHARRKEAAITDRRLQDPSLALCHQAESLLFEIGKYVLSAYGCFEE